MAKKKAARKTGGAAGIATFEEVRDPDDIDAADDIVTEQDSPEEAAPVKRAPKKQPKAKEESSSSNGQVGVGDIKKAAAFVNAVGGLDKAMSLLQILKVAREVQ